MTPHEYTHTHHTSQISDKLLIKISEKISENSIFPHVYSAEFNLLSYCLIFYTVLWYIATVCWSRFLRILLACSDISMYWWWEIYRKSSKNEIFFFTMATYYILLQFQFNLFQINHSSFPWQPIRSTHKTCPMCIEIHRKSKPKTSKITTRTQIVWEIRKILTPISYENVHPHIHSQHIAENIVWQFLDSDRFLKYSMYPFHSLFPWIHISWGYHTNACIKISEHPHYATLPPATCVLETSRYEQFVFEDFWAPTLCPLPPCL